MVRRRQAADGRELRIRFSLLVPDHWIVEVEGDRREYQSHRLRSALAEATENDARTRWVIALEDQVSAHLCDSRSLDIPVREMEHYGVLTADKKKAGRVLGTTGDFVIVGLVPSGVGSAIGREHDGPRPSA